MKWTRRKLFIIAVVLVSLLALELGREQFMYMFARSDLEHGYWRVHQGMTKDEVVEVLGQPDRVRKVGAEEDWSWLSAERQGWLWKLTRLYRLKKHYELSVTFDERQTVADVFGEVR